MVGYVLYNGTHNFNVLSFRAWAHKERASILRPMLINTLLNLTMHWCFSFYQVQTFVKKNIVLTGGFAGGFLLGLAS
jgi:hypothetical protein